jgi:hypothetical protein
MKKFMRYPQRRSRSYANELMIKRRKKKAPPCQRIRYQPRNFVSVSKAEYRKLMLIGARFFKGLIQ